MTGRRKYFYCNLNIKDITDADYKHGKRVKRGFEMKDLSKYHDLDGKYVI